MHRRVMPGQPVVQALPGIDEIGGGGPELRLSGERQRRLVEQEAQIIQYHPASGHDAVQSPQKSSDVTPLWCNTSCICLITERRSCISP